MLGSPGAARRARRVAAVVLVALGLPACSGGGRSPAGPDSAAAPATTATQGASATAATAPGSATTAPPGQGATTAPPGPAATAAGLAATLTRAERAIRDPATPDRELPALGHAQQRAYRAVVRDPALLPTVLSLVPATLRPVVRANVAAGVDLRKLSRPGPRLPPWRIVAPRPAAARQWRPGRHGRRSLRLQPQPAVRAGGHRLRPADARRPACLPRLSPVAGLLRRHPAARGLPGPPGVPGLTGQPPGACPTAQVTAAWWRRPAGGSWGGPTGLRGGPAGGCASSGARWWCRGRWAARTTGPRPRGSRRPAWRVCAPGRRRARRPPRRPSARPPRGRPPPPAGETAPHARLPGPRPGRRAGRAVPRRWRQVMGGDRGQRKPRIAGRAAAPAALPLEPDQPVGQHPLGRQPLADALLDRAEVLADHQRPGPVALQGQHAEQVVGGVADVGPLAGRGARRDPEQAEQAHHVVEPQPAGVRHPCSQRAREGLVPRFGQAPGDERRQRPVLPVRAEQVA